MSASYTIWNEHLAQGPPFRAGRTSPLACCEWMRLLVGRSLALSQLRSSGREGEEWIYLVLGVGVRHMRQVGDEDGLRLAAEAVRRDFEQLRRSINELRRRLNPQSPIEAPEAFLRTFDLVLGLRLPTDRSSWIVTDEGLTIVDWGLWREKDRPLLEWTDEQLRAMEQQLTAELGPDMSNGSLRGGATSAAAALTFRPARAMGVRPEEPEAQSLWMNPQLAWGLAALLLLTTLFASWRCSVAKRSSQPAAQVQADSDDASSQSGGTGSNAGTAPRGAESNAQGTKPESVAPASPAAQPAPSQHQPANDGGRSNP